MLRDKELRLSVNHLNETLLWIWIVSLNHFVGAIPAGYQWTGLGLKGPYQSDMYIQKVPTPDDLMKAPTGNFTYIDKGVAQNIFEDLNNSAYVNNDKSPRCPIF